MRAARQVKRALPRACLEDWRDQQILSDHHLVVVAPTRGIIIEMKERRTQHWRVAHAGVAHERVEVRHQMQP